MIWSDRFTGYIEQPQEWHFSKEEEVARGWFITRDGTPVLDLRAKLDGRTIWGIYGLHRADVQSVFPGNRLALWSGFHLVVRPWKDAKDLRLEALLPGGEWHEVLRVDVTCAGPELPAAPAKPMLPLVAGLEGLHYLYRHFHYRSLKEIRAEARRIVDDLVVPFCAQYPYGELYGHLDIPEFWVNSHYDKFQISGWTFHAAQAVTKVTAKLGVNPENRLIYGKERDDVYGIHGTTFPQSKKSHFYGLVDVSKDEPSPACLTVWAEVADGSRHLAFSRRLHLNRCDENDGPVPLYREAKFWLCVEALLEGALFGKFRIEEPGLFREGIFKLREKLQEKLARRAPTKEPIELPWQQQDPYTRWVKHNQLSASLRTHLEGESKALAALAPKISIVVPLYNTPQRYLDELLASVRGQIYPNWELCLADDASPQSHVVRTVKAAAAADPRIKYVVRPQNGHISAATNSALDLAMGEFVAFLDHDDLLPPDALLHVATALQENPKAGMLYTDEDKIDDSGKRFDPQFKGAWSPEMAITHNYTHHLTVMRRDLVEQAGRLRLGFHGAQDIDLILRVVELLGARPVIHVPHVCYHWRAHHQSTASKGDQKGYLFDAARRAIAEAVQRRSLPAEVFLPEWAKRNALCLHQLKWNASVLAANHVTIVIPTRNRADLLAKCLASLDRTVNWAHANVIIVDDGSDDPATLELFAKESARTDRKLRVIRAGEPGGEFNYSRLVNVGTRAATTPLVLHLNNDVEAMEAGWLEDLAGWFSLSHVGVVGARLVRNDGSLDHAGIVIPPKGALPQPLFAGAPAEDFGYLFWPLAARNVSAVTGAALMTRRSLYEELGGFDETDFRVAYNDVDYCLRAGRAGFRTVYSPQATLTHLGSASRGKTYTEKEHIAFVARYPGFRDPFLPEGVELTESGVRVNPHDFRPARIPAKPRIAIVTHNLNFEGAPLFIYEYARYFKHEAGFDVKVYTAQDGPLGKVFAEAGMPVEFIDAKAALAAKTPEELDAAIASIAQHAPWADRDVILANTMLSFWAVKAAKRLGKPSLFYIHESAPVGKFFSQNYPLALEIHTPIARSFGEATRVIFLCNATQSAFADVNRVDNYRIVPSWVELAKLEKFAADNSKVALRAKHHIPQDAVVIANVGSVCMRKGQHIYIRGIDQLYKLHGDELALRTPAQFLIVGAREGLYLETIESDIALMGLTNVKIVPETREVFDWFRLADVFCCTSFEESFPRVLLEAAALKVPIVTTDVHGIPEMLVWNDEAIMIPAGNPTKLAEALKRALDEIHRGDDKMASMAYARIARDFDARVSLPRHVTMAREAFFAP